MGTYKAGRPAYSYSYLGGLPGSQSLLIPAGQAIRWDLSHGRVGAGVQAKRGPLPPAQLPSLTSPYGKAAGCRAVALHGSCALCHPGGAQWARLLPGVPRVETCSRDGMPGPDDRKNGPHPAGLSGPQHVVLGAGGERPRGHRLLQPWCLPGARN